MIGDPRSEYLARVFGAASYEFLPYFFASASVLTASHLPLVLGVSDHTSFCVPSESSSAPPVVRRVCAP